MISGRYARHFLRSAEKVNSTRGRGMTGTTKNTKRHERRDDWNRRPRRNAKVAETTRPRRGRKGDERGGRVGEPRMERISRMRDWQMADGRGSGFRDRWLSAQESGFSIRGIRAHPWFGFFEVSSGERMRFSGKSGVCHGKMRLRPRRMREKHRKFGFRPRGRGLRPRKFGF